MSEPIEYKALLRAVVSDPADDTARMVFADWFQEQGDHDRAEFIRDQIEMRFGSVDFDLLDYNWDRWFPGVKRSETTGFLRHAPTQGIQVPLASGSWVAFTRGFLSHANYRNVASYMASVRSGYWAQQPVSHVGIQGREPDVYYPTGDPDGPYYRWFIDGDEYDGRPHSLSAELPEELFWAFHDRTGTNAVRSLVRQGQGWEFNDVYAARDALSLGAVALGRVSAGLRVEFGPPLEAPS